MRVLLSGGAGFIGSHVAEALRGRDYEVAIVDDLSSSKRGNVPEGAHLYEPGIRSGCAEIFEDFGPEAPCHQRRPRWMSGARSGSRISTPTSTSWEQSASSKLASSTAWGRSSL
jgi:NAD dependent epimerase/dehydratase family